MVIEIIERDLTTLPEMEIQGNGVVDYSLNEIDFDLCLDELKF